VLAQDASALAAGASRQEMFEDARAAWKASQPPRPVVVVPGTNAPLPAAVRPAPAPAAPKRSIALAEGLNFVPQGQKLSSGLKLDDSETDVIRKAMEMMERMKEQ
jgi:hypothetical protein